MADVKAAAPAGVNVDVVKKGDAYALKVTKDKKTAEIPLKDVKTPEEAEMIKNALLEEIDKAAVQQGTKSQGVGAKMDKVA